MARGEIIEVEDLGPLRQIRSPERDGDAAVELIDLNAAEKRHIEYVVRACGGSISEAAAILGIARSTLYNKISTYKIKV